MAATAASSTTGNHSSDPFALAFGIPPQNAVPVPNIGHTTDLHETERLSIELSEKNTLISRLQQDLNTLQAEFNKVLEGNQDMQRQLNERPQEVTNLQTLQNVASALTDAQPSDVIPAPPMFFTSDSHVRSPFDDIIQPVTVESVSLAPPQHTVEQAKIEDLQRNVSDLEKHAQDLEHKLAMRNQRESEYEDRLRDFESRFQDRELLLQQTKMELQSVQDEHEKLIANQAEVALLQNEIGALRQQVSNLDCLLQQKDQELDHLRSEHLRQRDELQLKKTINSLESQIIDPTIQPTLDMFFGNAPAQDFEPFVIPQVSAEPVVEEIIVPKKVYDCHPEEKHDKLEIGGDDWGDSWGNNDAAAEAEHFAKHTASVTGSAPTSLVPREQLLEIQMQDLNERLQELQLSLERSEEQKKELHIKSGKLMKKLKEYKVKIEELQSSTNSAVFRKSSSIESNSMFGDLDAAIQEEMKNQIKTLETKLSEQLKQQEHFNVEKEKLLKRIDVLTSGNDRMTEMKERQDMEVQMYQARIRELQQKLQTLDDWGTDSNTNEPSQMTVTEVHSQSTVANSNEGALQEKINALTLEIQDISSDRLELQALLEEEKANSQRAEQTVESLRQKLAIFEDNKPTDDMTQLNNLRIEMKNLQESYNNLLDANKKQSFEFQTQADVLSLSQSNELRLQSEVDKLQAEAENLKETLANTKQSLIDLESELSSLKELKEKQLDAAINKPVNPSSQQLEILQSEKQLLEEQVRILNEENEALKGTLAERTQIEHDHKALEERIQNLQAENDYLKQATVGGSSCDELSAQLQEKESEILHLKQRINDLMNEDQTEKLVLEILTKNQEIQLLKMQVKELEEDKHELENNLSIQITKDMQANKDDVNKVPTGTSREQELENQVDELLTEKKHMEEELQVLNNHIMESLKQEDKMKLLTLELDTKNVEISELRKTIETLQNNSGGVGMTAKSDVSLDYAALNAQWESVVEQRCGEIAKMWQDHLAQRELDFKAQEERLRTEINALRSNHSSNVTIEPVQNVVSAETSSESTTASGTTSAEASQDGTPLRIRPQDNDANVDAIIEQMQNALESQEMEIVTLKEQLAIRSAEYARLAAQYDPFKLQNTSSHIGIVESRKSAVTPDVATVSKSELDLALYMLHQRDMRCEEMTLELVSLLEERDTLQLKLSNTLRQMETIKAKTAGSGLTDGMHQFFILPMK